MRHALTEIDKLSLLVWDRDDVVSFILSAITYEQKAEIELDYDCMELVQGALGTDMSGDTYRAVSLVAGLGRKLFKQLRDLNIYRHGYLYYGLHSWVGDDVVLSRLLLDKNPEIHHVPQ